MKTATIAKTLEKAAALLINKGWTQGAFARTANGVACDRFSKRAASYCAVGALCRAQTTGAKRDSFNYEQHERVRQIIDTLFVERDTLVELNDEVVDSGADLANLFLLAAEIAKEG